jgi:hypothetical protein
MLISPADVRRLMEAGDPDATLAIYQGRTVVIPGDDLTANRYPGALLHHIPAGPAGFLGRHVTSEQDIEHLATSLEVTASELGG